MSSRCLGSMITLFLSSLSLLLFWESDGIRYVTFRNDGEATSLDDSIRIKLSVHQPLSVLCRDIGGGGGSHTGGKRRERRVFLFLIPFPIQKLDYPHRQTDRQTQQENQICVSAMNILLLWWLVVCLPWSRRSSSIWWRSSSGCEAVLLVTLWCGPARIWAHLHVATWSSLAGTTHHVSPAKQTNTYKYSRPFLFVLSLSHSFSQTAPTQGGWWSRFFFLLQLIGPFWETNLSRAGRVD